MSPIPGSDRQIEQMGSECDRNVFSFQKLVGEAAEHLSYSPSSLPSPKPVIGISSYVDPVLPVTCSFVQLANVKQQIHPNPNVEDEERGNHSKGEEYADACS